MCQLPDLVAPAALLRQRGLLRTPLPESWMRWTRDRVEMPESEGATALAVDGATGSSFAGRGSHGPGVRPNQRQEVGG